MDRWRRRQITGVVSAATGVQVMPSMPFMQAIGLEKDELVQALGFFFTVATVALAFNLTAAGLLSAETALPAAVARPAAFAGMLIGQAVRSRMQPEAFRRWFLIALIFLGLYLAGSAIYNAGFEAVFKPAFRHLKPSHPKLQ